MWRVALDLAVPSFHFKRHLGPVVVIERDERRQCKHRRADEEASPGGLAGMRLYKIVDREPHGDAAWLSLAERTLIDNVERRGEWLRWRRVPAFEDRGRSDRCAVVRDPYRLKQRAVRVHR